MRSLLEEPQLSVEFEASPKPRRRRRLPYPKLTRRRVIVAAAIVVALGVASTWLLYFSSVLALKQVVVQGVRAIAPNQVVAQAQLHSGEPLAGIDTDLVAARIAGMSTVAHVEVWQRWPDTVVIDVVERDRVAAVKVGGQFDILDQTGFTLEHKRHRPEKIPLLQASDDQARQTALSLLHGFPPELASLVESVTAASGDQIVLGLHDGVTVVWGDSQDSAEKTRVLRALLGHLGSDKWVDLRSPTNPSSAKTSPTPAPPPATPTPTPASPSGSASGAAPTEVPTQMPTAPSGQPSSGGDAVPVPAPSTYSLPR